MFWPKRQWTKSRRSRLAWHAARVEENRGGFKILIGKATGQIPVGRPRSSWRTILQWILKKLMSIQGLGLIQLREEIIR